MKKILYFVAITFATFITCSCKEDDAEEATNQATVTVYPPTRSYHGISIKDDWLSEGEKLIVDSVSVYNGISNEKMKIESVTYCVDDDAIATSYQSPFGCEFTIGEAPIGLLSVGLHTLSEIIKVDGGEKYGELCDTLQGQFRMFADTTNWMDFSVVKKEYRGEERDMWAVMIGVDSCGIFNEVGGDVEYVTTMLDGVIVSRFKPSLNHTTVCLSDYWSGLDGEWSFVAFEECASDVDGSMKHTPHVASAEGWATFSSYPEGSELTVRVSMSCELDEKYRVETYTTTL